MSKKDLLNQASGYGKYAKVESVGKTSPTIGAGKTTPTIGAGQTTPTIGKKWSWSWLSLEENGRKRFVFLFLLGLVLLGAWIVTPLVYTWFGENKWLALFVALIAIGYIIKGPRSTFVLRVAILALLSMGIYNGLSEENVIKKEWWPTNAKPTRIQPVPQEAHTPQFVKRTAELTATQHDFTWVRIPDLARLHNFGCPSGTLMAVVHKGNPNGHTYDCDQNVPIALGDGLLDFNIGFRSKKAEAIHVTVKVLIPK